MGKAIIIPDMVFTTNIGSITLNSEVVELVSISLLQKPSSIINSFQLSLIFVPSNATDKGVIWNSSNPNIATVGPDGHVDVVSEGEVTFTVTSVHNPSLVDSFSSACSLTDIPVASIAVSGPSSGNVGDTVQLIATVLPLNATNKTMIWSSSNPAVATVTEDGSVSFLSEGSVVITATAQSNDLISDSLIITVLESTFPNEYPAGGLLLFLDATDKTPSDTGTTWEDLSGNNNHFTLYNFLMDGVDGWGMGELLLKAGSQGAVVISKGDSNIVRGGLGNGIDGETTFFMRVKFTGSNVYELYFTTIGFSSSTSFHIQGHRTGIAFASGSTSISVAHPNSTDKYITAAVRIKNDEVKVYSDNLHKTQELSSVLFDENSPGLCIGGWVRSVTTHAAQGIIQGGIKQVLLYDRALSDDEVSLIIDLMGELE